MVLREPQQERMEPLALVLVEGNEELVLETELPYRRDNSGLGRSAIAKGNWSAALSQRPQRLEDRDRLVAHVRGANE